MEITARDFQEITQQQHQNVKQIAIHSLTDKTGRSTTRVAATIECFICHENNYVNKCNFEEKTCHTSGNKGHSARVCQSSKRAPTSTQTQQDGRR